MHLQCRGSRQVLQNGAWLLQCYMRAAELEMRAAEAPLQADLDVKGFKAQVLERIGELEEQERERQELLTQITTVAQENRLIGAGAAKAVLGR